jgi:hypothetical protein
MRMRLALFAHLTLAMSLPASGAEDRHPECEPDLCWQTSYAEAVHAAKQEKKMLLVYFAGRRNDPAREAFAKNTLNDPKVLEGLSNYVLCRIVDRERILFGRRKQDLLEHPAFAEMQGRPGIAVIDFAHEKEEYYGKVVSAFPFSEGRYYNPAAMLTILQLPPGTLTQRTMIYAVRVHPERPASTQSQFHPALANAAKSHSFRMASSRNQGHHNWGSRAQQISYQVGAMPVEIVAESWPGQSLLEACKDCVGSWRQSGGHWGNVRSRNTAYGYDIQRGRNGIWYATGIFAR